jgi:hypothetical protein
MNLCGASLRMTVLWEFWKENIPNDIRDGLHRGYRSGFRNTNGPAMLWLREASPYAMIFSRWRSSLLTVMFCW